jgi:hypothetical protein
MLCCAAGDEADGADVAANKIDDKLDGVIIIDATGSILMANKVGANRQQTSACVHTL